MALGKTTSAVQGEVLIPESEEDLIDRLMDVAEGAAGIGLYRSYVLVSRADLTRVCGLARAARTQPRHS